MSFHGVPPGLILDPLLYSLLMVCQPAGVNQQDSQVCTTNCGDSGDVQTCAVMPLSASVTEIPSCNLHEINFSLNQWKFHQTHVMITKFLSITNINIIIHAEFWKYVLNNAQDIDIIHIYGKKQHLISWKQYNLLLESWNNTIRECIYILWYCHTLWNNMFSGLWTNGEIKG